jgi:hypothetical protein
MRSAPKRARKILAPLPFLKGERIFTTEMTSLKHQKRGTLAGAVLNDRAGESMTAKRKASELLNEPTDKVNQPIDYCYV